MSAAIAYHVLPGHNPLVLLQALRAAGVRYNIIGLHSYAYEVNEAVASSALYWNACLRLNQLFAEHASLKSFRFTEERTSAKTDSQVTSYISNRLGVASHMHSLCSLQALPCIVVGQHQIYTAYSLATYDVMTHIQHRD